MQSAMQGDNRNMTFPCPCPCPCPGADADATLPLVTAAAQRTPLPVGANFSSVWYFNNVVVAVGVSVAVAAAISITDVVIAATCPTMLQTQAVVFFRYSRHGVKSSILAWRYVCMETRERQKQRERRPGEKRSGDWGIDIERLGMSEKDEWIQNRDKKETERKREGVTKKESEREKVWGRDRKS